MKTIQIETTISLSTICRKVFEAYNFAEAEEGFTLPGVAKEVYKVLGWQAIFEERRVVTLEKKHYLFVDSDPNWARTRQAMTGIIHEKDKKEGHRLYLWFGSDDPNGDNIWKHYNHCTPDELEEWGNMMKIKSRIWSEQAKWAIDLAKQRREEVNKLCRYRNTKKLLTKSERSQGLHLE
jgi:hypothetical protein